eukprot:CAMPEP_0172481018 /NCGR_PEP_ID=MMETSP1066-20121228/6537_1 /TAXON_ID=671091 /ORGANISM="Coscinodiscus wailesii, Strain CCMP2513" /LENGTH=70 /DNA_ID=CAMNT_0013242895 /DNA_START=201 /DNA_END=413 /DNA_ORIENTATION=+
MNEQAAVEVEAAVRQRIKRAKQRTTRTTRHRTTAELAKQEASNSKANEQAMQQQFVSCLSVEKSQYDIEY